MKTRTKNRVGVSLLVAVLAIALGVSAIRVNRSTAFAADGPGNYQSDYASQNATLDASVDLNNQIAEESFVLLKNEDNVLPVATTSRVVVMGHGAEDRIAGGSGSGATGTNARQPATTIVQGLTSAGFSNITSVFTNTNNGGWSTNVQSTRTGSSAPQSTAARLQTVQGGDIVFVVISRTSGENVSNMNNANYSDQAVTGIASDHGHILELDNNEKQLLKIANDNNDNVVLVINAPNAMALDELKDPAYPNVKGAVWVGGVGNDGYNAFGRLVSGQANPSAHLPDSYVVDLTKDPTWFNWGNNTHVQGAASFQYRVGTSNSGRYGQYYEEGIYLGYRYYETRAHEYDPANPITRIGEVAYENGEEWYQNTVMYPFGFGLSYTTFEWEILEGQTTSTELPLTASSEIAIQVKVTNTGDYAGKDVVQLYYTAPYYKGGIEKSYKVLGDFEKTKLIQPGKSDVVTLHISLKEMSSYDYSDANKNNFKGYEAEAGEYVMHLSTDSHNIKTGKNGEKLDLTYVLEEGVLFATDEATGAPVGNLFDDISDDFNARATEFSRADMVGTFPVAPTTAEMTIDSTYQELLNESSWTYATSFNTPASSTNANAKRFSDNIPTTPWYIGGTSAQMPDYGKTLSRTVYLDQLVGRSYEDRRWDSFISQLTISEMYNLIRQGGYQTTAISRLGVPQTTNQDGPQTINRGVTYVAPVNVAATWNKELCYNQGRAIGNEGMWKNVEGWYAPAVNTHRSAFGGRNFEYYSECGVLAGKIAAEVVRGCTDKGLIVTVKHFALNDMETARSMVSAFATEQAMREIYLRAFELPVKAGALGIMTSFNYIGTNWAGGSYALNTQLLRDEWGFRGFVVTDYGAGNMDYAIRGGTDLSLNSGNPTQTNPTATQVYYMQRACKNILYAVANSMAMNTRKSQTQTTDHTNNNPGRAYRLPEYAFSDQTVSAIVNKEFMYRADFDYGSLNMEAKYSIVEGSLPAGLSMSRDGLISGTPTAKGNYTVTIKASPVTSGQFAEATADYTFSVTSGVVGYNGKTIDDARKGMAYTGDVGTAIGGNYTYALKSGSSLPNGLSMASDGTISGTPTVSGEFNFTVVATSDDGETTLEATFKLFVADENSVITYNPALADAKAGYPYEESVDQATGSGSISYAIVGDMPEGLSFDPSAKKIFGTPTTAGNYIIKITASAPNFEPVTVNAKLTVAAHDAVLSYAPATLTAAKVGTEYSADIATATGSNTITYSVKEGSELPLGLRLNGGNIEGTPAKDGTFTFTLVASAKNYDSVEATMTMTVAKGTLSYSGKALADAEVLTAYNGSIEIAGQMTGVSYKLKNGSNLPEGMTLNSSRAIISGAPTTAGEYTFTIVASLEGYEDAEATFTIKVKGAEEGKKGCKGAMGFSALGMLALVGAAAVVIRRKEDK